MTEALYWLAGATLVALVAAPVYAALTVWWEGP